MSPHQQKTNDTIGEYLSLPRMLAALVVHKTPVLCISLAIQNRHHRPRTLYCRLGPVLCFVIGTEIGDREARTISENLPSQLLVFDSMASTNHVQSCFARSVLH